VFRYRIEYGKQAPLSFISHLEMVKTWERTIRRSRLPIAFSSGFHPHCRISFGSVLPVGTASDFEYLDLELTENVSAEEVAARIREQLPAGLSLKAIRRVVPESPSLMSMINIAGYRFYAPWKTGQQLSQFELEERLHRLRARESWEITRKRKDRVQPIDIKPGIRQIEMTVSAAGVIGQFELLLGPSGSVRPSEAIEMLEMMGTIPIDSKAAEIERIGLWIERAEIRISPMVLGTSC